MGPQTDDVGIFCSPLSQEYYLAARHFKLSTQDVMDLCKGVVDMIFAGPEEKARLRQLYDSWDGWDVELQQSSAVASEP